MWLTIALAIESLFLIKSTLHFWNNAGSIGSYAMSLIFLWIVFYILLYVDSACRNGNRNWNRVRALKIWKKINDWWFPLDYHSQCRNFDTSKRYLFIVHPNPYNLGMIFGLGLHGGHSVLKKLNLLWMIPSIYLKIPILRDVLMWSGAVSQDNRNVVDLFNKGHSVALSPDGNKDSLRSKEDRLYVKMADDSIFNYALENGIEIVPVVIYGESELYNTTTSPKMECVRRFCFEKIGIPWPTIALGWYNTFLPKRKEIHIYIGSPVSAREKNDPQFKKKFYEVMKTLNSGLLDKPMELSE